ncbi:recombinase RecT [Rhodococcoides fascians]|uniref:recombinase RecT n=1 Tax=Rhodococcoides fascians TaxID=1828 RepID=UPI00068F19BD|nr:recombinase RecT [Rhodococcus fascians]
MTSLELHTGSALVIGNDQDFWSEKQKAALAQLGVQAANGDLAVFFHQCQRTGLDPFAKQIYMIERQGKQTIQTGIDGFRLIARRATDRSNGTLGYEDTLWCGEDGKWTDVWLSKDKPRAAKVTVIRDGARYPAIALWDEYVGKKGNGQVTQMWNTKGALMIAKCAEALSLRKAYPQDLSGIYTTDEMNNQVVDEDGQTVTDLGDRRQARQASSERVEQPKQQGGAAGFAARMNQQGGQPAAPSGDTEADLVESLSKRIEVETVKDRLLDLYYEAERTLTGTNAATVMEMAKARAFDIGVASTEPDATAPVDAEVVPEPAAA